MKKLVRIGKIIILAVAFIVVAFPFFWCLMLSFKSNAEIMSIPTTFFPSEWIVSGYKKVLTEAPFMTWLWNSLFSSVVSTAIVVFTSCLGGYIFGKFNFKGKNFLFVCVLITMMVPFQVMRLVGDILKEDTIKKGHIALVDLDEKLLRETEEAVKELVAFSGQEFEVTAHIDYKEALPGTDYLFNTIATGGYERWKSDIEVSTKHGVLQSVGDTIGPGGIIRALRTIPVILDVAKTMEEICPDAWIINYANPEGAICLALQKYTKIKNFGLCHGTPDMAKQLAEEVFKVPIERFTYRAAGINHLTWFTDMKIDGKDVYPKLHDKLKESGFDKKEPISKQLYDIYGLYPAPGDRHVGEFFPYYMKEEVLMEQDYEWKNNDFKVVDGWREEARVLFDEVRTKKEGYEEFLKGSGETATYFIRSLATGDISDEMVNVINNGYIDNVSSGIIVELPTYIDEFGLHPQKIGKLPDAIAAQCDRLGREYLLMVEAAATCNYELARQAMFLDPLVSNCKYPELLLKDLIRANLDLLPEAWEKHC